MRGPRNNHEQIMSKMETTAAKIMRVSSASELFDFPTTDFDFLRLAYFALKPSKKDAP